MVKTRKQLSMVLPSGLIAAIKQRASDRRLSITAYITELVRQDLAEGGDADADAAWRPLQERLQTLEARVTKLEQQEM